LAKWLAEQTDEVISVAFSPDGRAFLSGGSDKTLKLWDIATGREIRTFVGHTDSVIAVAFSPDGRNALSGSSDRTLKVLGRRDGKRDPHFGGAYQLGKFGRVLARRPQRAVWQPRRHPQALGRCDGKRDSHPCRAHEHGPFVAFSPDGKTALSGSADNTLKLWDVT
jgi:WD40 repeat protein